MVNRHIIIIKEWQYIRIKKGKVQMKIHNMTSERSGREVANQFIIEDKENVFFQSYNSMICKVDHAERTITFGQDWDYSRTTSKYLHKFLYDELCWSPCKADIQ